MPLDVYGATFTTTDAVTVGFDIRPGGYGERSDADATIRRVPWSQTQRVVVQTTGVNPSTREYRALVYGGAGGIDWANLHAVLGKTGVLTAGYPVNRQSPVNAVLMSLSLESIDNAGDVMFTAGFTVLGPA